MSPLTFPPPLEGDRSVIVVAPSGPFDRQQLKAGLDRLGDLPVSAPDGLFRESKGFLAGDDAVRRKELQDALDDEDCGAILIARGGYGLGRIIDDLDLTGFVRRPKWVCGFSDATVLHQRLFRAGVASLHGPNVTTLVQADAVDVEALIAALRGAELPAAEALHTVVSGTASGALVGGNLTVLFSEAAAQRLTLPPGALLFLEDVTETSYRIDRMLSSLLRAGFFEHVSGVVLGEFTDCSPGKFRVPTAEVLGDFFRRLGRPTVAGFPAGHGVRQAPFVHGAPYRLDAARGRLCPA